MTKEELAFRITRAVYKDGRNLESLNAYQCIRDYFLDLEMEDLLGIAGQYGVKVHSFDDL